MSELEALLHRRIRAEGPMTLADFMALALAHPDAGYYTTRDPLGAERERGGDFVTAPEISQMFGELIGLWLCDIWQRSGSPAPFRLVELGPGRGTLMADALRAARLLPGFLEAADLHLVEISPPLRACQAKALARHEPTWHESFAEVPSGPLFVIANEFFDALPLRQFVFTAGGWSERLVALDEAGKLTFGLSSPSQTAGALLDLGRQREESGWLAEVSATSLLLANEIAKRIEAEGGAALIIDYGYREPPGRSTLQALRRHRRHEILEAPGDADLTAHVDLGALAASAAATGAAVWGPDTQGAFLAALGIEARAGRLLEGASAAHAADIKAARERLIGKEAMGELFKALAILPSSFHGPPAGLTGRFQMTPPAGSV